MELKTIKIQPMPNVGTALEIEATFYKGSETVTRHKVIVRNGISMKIVKDLTTAASKLFDVDSPA